MPVSAVWIRRIGPNVELLVEVDGVWRLIATEAVAANFGHIVEARAFRQRPLDPLASLEPGKERT